MFTEHHFIVSIVTKGKHLEYRNVHYPGAFQVIIKSIEKSIDNLHFYIICTEVTYTIYVQRGTTSAVYYKSRAFKVEPVNKVENAGTEKVKLQKH